MRLVHHAVSAAAHFRQEGASSQSEELRPERSRNLPRHTVARGALPQRAQGCSQPGCHTRAHRPCSMTQDEQLTLWISLSSTPSVMNLILVSSVTFPSYRI